MAFTSNPNTVITFHSGILQLFYLNKYITQFTTEYLESIKLTKKNKFEFKVYYHREIKY